MEYQGQSGFQVILKKNLQQEKSLENDILTCTLLYFFNECPLWKDEKFMSTPALIQLIMANKVKLTTGTFLAKGTPFTTQNEKKAPHDTSTFWQIYICYLPVPWEFKIA